MKKTLKISLLAFLIGLNLFLFFGDTPALAQTNFTPPSVLPSSDVDIGGGKSGNCIGLASMIKTGEIHLWNLPCFVKLFTQTLISVGGTLAVIFVMIGGYRYVVGKDEDKDVAKKTITYSLIGLAISLLAWVIVDIVLQVATE